MRLRTIGLLPLLLAGLVWGQTVSDDFSDGDLSQNPTWTGDLAQFTHENGRLRSDGPAASDQLSIATAVPTGSQVEWRLDMDYGFGPSGSNRIRVYLWADSANLEGDRFGYYLEVGETGSSDGYDLYRQDGNSSVLLIDGLDGRAGMAIDATIRVRRANDGTWTLETHPGNGLWQSEGSANDNTYPSGSFLGIQVTHSSTRNQSFFFDNLYCGPWEIDQTPPTLLTAEALSAQTLRVLFDEPMDSLSLMATGNYTVDGGLGSPQSVLWINSQEVELAFANAFQDQQPYLLTVTAVADLSGNAIAGNNSAPFTWLAPVPITYGMLRINEIMADPTPSQGLPEVEYVEILNRSGSPIDLAGWQLSRSTGGGTLGSYLLPPGQVALLVSSSDTAAFAGTPAIVPVSGWPALVNSGTTLSLVAADGTLVDSVSYRSELYSDPTQANGGVSLELQNPENLSCPAASNWDGSEATVGGTPGSANSIFDPLHDQTPARPISVAIVDGNLIELCFSHPMDPTNLDQASAYQLLGLGPAEGVRILGPERRCVELSFGGNIPLGQAFWLRIENQSSCFGRGFQVDSIQVLQGFPPQPLDLLINELMADETPSRGLPEAEFVEVYNPTSRVLDLSGLGITDGSTAAYWGNAQLLPGGYAVVCDAEDTTAFAGLGLLLPVEGMPSLNNSDDLVQLIDANEQVLDEVRYEDSWYRDPDRDDGGVSLEKIDPNQAGCLQPGNWRASLAVAGGTPGAVNSVLGSFADTLPPQLLSLQMEADNELTLVFSEAMDPARLADPGRYEVLPGPRAPIAATAEDDNRAVSLLFLEDFPADSLFTLQWDSLADCEGNLMQDSARFGKPVPVAAGDILVSELLANPFSGGSDFVEIYNASPHILDLSELRLGEGIPGTDSIVNSDPVAGRPTIFLPGQYLCLTRDVAIQQATYLPPGDAAFLEMAGFPSYDDGEGEVVLFTNSGLVLERFAYEDDFHYPDLRNEEGISLERISFRVPAKQPDNWHSAASTVRFATPGYANSQADPERAAAPAPVWLEPTVITPDGDGVDDVAAIRYQFNEPGNNARITILDRSGRLVRTIRQQELLGTTEGSFFWDGRSDDGQRLPIGPYVLLVETTNQNTGTRNLFRLVLVIGG